MSEAVPIKLYFDYKSPYAFLAMLPAFDLPDRYRVSVRWIPYLLRIKGKGSGASTRMEGALFLHGRSPLGEPEGRIPHQGPLEVYDSTASLIGGLFAQDRDCFRPYTETVYARFFRRELEIDDPEAVAGVIDELGHSGSEYLAWAGGEGADRFEACVAEGEADHIFGVPIFLFDGEPFWGHDRIPLLEERLTERGLRR